MPSFDIVHGLYGYLFGYVAPPFPLPGGTDRCRWPEVDSCEGARSATRAGALSAATSGAARGCSARSSSTDLAHRGRRRLEATHRSHHRSPWRQQGRRLPCAVLRLARQLQRVLASRRPHDHSQGVFIGEAKTHLSIEKTVRFKDHMQSPKLQSLLASARNTGRGAHRSYRLATPAYTGPEQPRLHFSVPLRHL